MKRMNRSFPYAQTLLISTGVSVGGSMLMLCLISLFLSAADIPSGATAYYFNTCAESGFVVSTPVKEVK